MKPSDVRTRVLAELAGGEMTVSDLATRFGLTACEPTVRKAVKALAADGLVTRRSGRRTHAVVMSAAGGTVTASHATTFWRLADA